MSKNSTGWDGFLLQIQYKLTVNYLFLNGKEDLAMQIHEISLGAVLFLIIINSENDFSFGIIGGATIAMENQGFHPYRKCFSF